MSDSATGPRRSARNAAKRVAETVEQVVKPAAKKTKAAAAPKKAAATKKSKDTTPEAAVDATEEKEPTIEKETVSELKEGDEVPADLPEVTTHTGEIVKLDGLVSKSEKGIVIFAYPKASTPGCTTQACLFRDATKAFTDAGYAIYGISGDSPKSNTNFHTKQNLADIILLCDPTYELHAKLGIKKSPKGTIRSVTVIKKDGDKATILKKSPASPAKSLEIAKQALDLE